MLSYIVEDIEEVLVAQANGDGPLAGYDLMSPFVWTEGDRYSMLVRVLPNPLAASDPTGVIWCGDSDEGILFNLRDRPSVEPGPDPADAGGCEDPTVVKGTSGDYLIFYTGVDRERRQGALLVASGPDLCRLTKHQVLLKAPKGEGNIKEATLAQGSDGQYRLFYEYAQDNASRVGLAIGPSEQGPWTVLPDPFHIRPDSWDNWHLSTGPIVQMEGADPVMFYNGATSDARWRIGWVSFSPDFSRVTGRGVEPLLMPPPTTDRTATDIAFAASCLVMGKTIWLYYSLEDKILRRARIRRYRAE